MKNIKIPVIALLFVSTIGCEAQKRDGVKVLSPQEATAMLAEDELTLIDVRTPEEFAEGHIEGAQNINFLNVNFKVQMQQLDKEKPVYIYCRSGNRSAKAAEKLQEMGFQKIYDIEGDILNWEG
ncbi:rhodanese-like domain-containing protein [Salegentibacter sp. F188]|uniref:Rhodanese-like domain-containing protein n=1 Tax=Autumnicola patrickiae TaxID=3075591 RepID=A0ABU3E4L4_9FLAO|nr:rhodanese-like domain-containing protein [Salegentibacter sp. F188]MDT0690933.1 rhodanese-like domain-containing protein [Salegentibacter sp. F188]